MTTTYTLKIQEMHVVPELNNNTDVVIRASWAYTGTTEDGRSAGFGGSTDFVLNDQAPFVPYEELTEEQVSGWVLNTWTEEELNTRQAAIESQLTVVTKNLPWNTNQEPTIGENNGN